VIKTAAPEKQAGSEASVRRPKRASPCAMIIFLVTGDLSKRLLFPALFSLTSWRDL